MEEIDFAAVITEHEVKARLLAAIERRDQPEARDRMARWGVIAVVREVLKIIREEVRKETHKGSAP